MKRRLLAIFPKLAADRAKNAHLLVLKYLQDEGWRITVLTIDDRSPSAGKTAQKPEPFIEDWCGMRLRHVRPAGWRWSLLIPLARLRRTKRAGVVRKLISRLLQPVQLLLAYPDQYATQRARIAHHANSVHAQEPFDVVVSLYHPWTAHRAAAEWSTQHGVPWVALTKDFYSWPVWLLRHYKGDLNPVSRLVNLWKCRGERKLLESARAVLTVTDSHTDHLRDVIGSLIPVHTLAHCYDPADFADRVRENRHDETDTAFRIVAVGRLLPKHDRGPLGELFRSIAELHGSARIGKGDLRIRFVGSGGNLALELARRAGCEWVVETLPAADHSSAIREMASADCLLYLQTPFGSRRRLAEYVGSGRPILAYPGFPDAMADTQLRLLERARVADNPRELGQAILELVSEADVGSRDMSPENLADSDSLSDLYSAVTRAAQLHRLLDEIVAGGRHNSATGVAVADNSGTAQRSVLVETPSAQGDWSESS